ncbi:MAG: MurR/RpiR family transcriptional regulator [Pseudomonadota bacterium]
MRTGRDHVTRTQGTDPGTDTGTAPGTDPGDAPSSAEAVLALIEARFDSFSPQLRLAARFIADAPREVGVQSMRALAGRAEVHPNTLVRLAQTLGFDGFDSLRERFRDFVVTEGMGGFRDRADRLGAMAAEGGTAAVLAGMAEATAANVETAWRRADPALLDRVADAILGARRVYVLGMGSAYSLAHQFWYVARMALDHMVPIPRHGSQPIDDLATLTDDDVVLALTFQPYRAETMAAVRHAREAGATVIGISDSATAPLAGLAQLYLAVPTSTPQFFQSHAAVTALLEGILAVTVARAGPAAAEAIDCFHRQRQAAGLYEEPEALARLG